MLFIQAGFLPLSKVFPGKDF
jgi:hypothetical protein